MAKGSGTWKRLKFGEVAECVNDRVDDPKAAGVDRYVGLEHLDPESLAIRRWGNPSDVESTKLRFKPGDIIFGKRRAYQRKLAVADFDGICSAHAMVLRAKPKTVLPEFLPFFMQSDFFMERAVAISVGSLSPTINWKSLAAEEFVLPPLEEQRRAVILLDDVRGLAESSSELREAAHACCRSWLRATAERLLAGAPRTVPLGELLDGSPDSGCSAHEREEETGYWVLGLSSLTSSGYVASEYKAVDRTPAMLSARLSHGDLLITRSNTRERVGFVGQFVDDGREVSFPDTMMRLRPKVSRVSAEWLELMLQSAPIRGAIQATAAGTSASMKKINRQNLLAILVPDVSLSEQEAHIDAFSTLRKAELSAATRMAKAHELRRTVTAEVVKA